jgi:LytS/YehU family sensor histidine kinase
VTARRLRQFPLWQSGATLHLLANTLSTVGTLLRRRPEAAEDLLAHFTGYLRAVLGERRALIPLADELVIVRALIGVERARFGSRLRFEARCAPDALEMAVPQLALHPIVENAIWHGVARRLPGGCVRVSARRTGGHLLIVVSDDGPGFRRPPARAGWGLLGVRQRLAALWGSAGRLRVLTRPGSRFRQRVPSPPGAPRRAAPTRRDERDHVARPDRR